MKLLAFDTSTEACSVAVQVNGETLSDHRIVQREHATLLLPMLSQLLAQFDVSAKHIDGVVFGQGPGSFTGLRIAAAAAQGLALAADCGVYGVSTLQAMAFGCARESDVVQSDVIRSNAAKSEAEQGDKKAPTERYIMSAVDARMDQIYGCAYKVEYAAQSAPAAQTAQAGQAGQAGQAVPVGPIAVTAMAEEVVVDPDSYLWPEELASAHHTESKQPLPMELLLCGSGATRYEQELRQALKGNDPLTIKLIADVFPQATDLLRLTDTSNPSIWKQAAEAQPVYLRNKVALTEAERSST